MVHRAQQAYPVSERRACRVLRYARATQRYESVKHVQAALRGRIRQIAGEHVTWGYLSVWVRLRREGWLVNKKRVHRLYKLEGLCVGRHRPRRRRLHHFDDPRGVLVVALVHQHHSFGQLLAGLGLLRIRAGIISRNFGFPFRIHLGHARTAKRGRDESIGILRQ